MQKNLYIVEAGVKTDSFEILDEAYEYAQEIEAPEIKVVSGDVDDFGIFVANDEDPEIIPVEVSEPKPVIDEPVFSKEDAIESGIKAEEKKVFKQVVQNIVADRIKDELKAMQDYKNDADAIEAQGKNLDCDCGKKIADNFKDLAKEENRHIGELENIANKVTDGEFEKEIQAGKEESKKEMHDLEKPFEVEFPEIKENLKDGVYDSHEIDIIDGLINQMYEDNMSDEEIKKRVLQAGMTEEEYKAFVAKPATAKRDIINFFKNKHSKKIKEDLVDDEIKKSDLKQDLLKRAKDLLVGVHFNNKFMGDCEILDVINYIDTPSTKAREQGYNFDLEVSVKPSEGPNKDTPTTINLISILVGGNVDLEASLMAYLKGEFQDAAKNCKEATLKIDQDAAAEFRKELEDSEKEKEKAKQLRKSELIVKNSEAAFNDMEKEIKDMKAEDFNDFYVKLGWLAKHVISVGAKMNTNVEPTFDAHYPDAENKYVVDARKRTSGGFPMLWGFGAYLRVDNVDKCPGDLAKMFNENRELNNTKFVLYLVNDFGFKFSNKQDLGEIMLNIPEDELEHFNIGYHLTDESGVKEGLDENIYENPFETEFPQDISKDEAEAQLTMDAMTAAPEDIFDELATELGIEIADEILDVDKLDISESGESGILVATGELIKDESGNIVGSEIHIISESGESGIIESGILTESKENKLVNLSKDDKQDLKTKDEAIKDLKKLNKKASPKAPINEKLDKRQELHNSALNLAKKIKKPVIYGYTDKAGKFNEIEAKEFNDSAARKAYPDSTYSVAYPDKNEIKESKDLNESSWVEASEKLKDGRSISYGWEKGEGYYVEVAVKASDKPDMYRREERKTYASMEDAKKAYERLKNKILNEKLYNATLEVHDVWHVDNIEAKNPDEAYQIAEEKIDNGEEDSYDEFDEGIKIEEVNEHHEDQISDKEFKKEVKEYNKNLKKAKEEAKVNEGFGDYKEYDPQEGWTEEDIKLHKSIDWSKIAEKDVGDEFKGKIYLYGNFNKPESSMPKMPVFGVEEREATFHKFLRSNPIFPPYYKAIEKVDGFVGPMFDGRKHKTYDIHDRYETQEINDMLSEAYDDPMSDKELAEKLEMAYKDKADKDCLNRRAKYAASTIKPGVAGNFQWGGGISEDLEESGINLDESGEIANKWFLIYSGTLGELAYIKAKDKQEAFERACNEIEDLIFIEQLYGKGDVTEEEVDISEVPEEVIKSGKDAYVISQGIDPDDYKYDF